MIEFAPKRACETLPNIARNVFGFPNKPSLREKNRYLAKLDVAQGRDCRSKILLWLADMGLDRADSVAIIGRNRPALYWAMNIRCKCAAQFLFLCIKTGRRRRDDFVFWATLRRALVIVAGDQEQMTRSTKFKSDPRVEQMI